VVTVVVPFRFGGKSRLPDEVRAEVAVAMLRQVLAAALAHADRVRLVTDDVRTGDAAVALGVEVVADPGGGQGAAVEAALAGVEGICLVVNADLPRVQPSDLAALAAGALADAVVIAASADGTTNALGLPSADVFTPLYGPGSAARFRTHAEALGRDVHILDLPNLRDDVDTAADLERFGLQP